MIKDTQLTPDWEKKFDPHNIDRLPRMKWQAVVEKMAKFIDLMTGNIDIGCTACPAQDHCDHRDCYKGMMAWVKDKMRCEWDG